MSTMSNFTVRSLAANRVRTIVTIAGVALAAALLSAVLTSYASLTDFLYRSEATTSGTWMSLVGSDYTDTFADEIDDAKNDPNVTNMATFTDKGFAQLSEEEQRMLGTYLPVIAAEGDLESVTAIRPSEGRLPENPHEIMLFGTWKTHRDVAIGDTITLQVGKRQAVAASGAADTTASSTTLGLPEDDQSSISAGSLLNSSIGYLEVEEYGGSFNEQLIDLHEESYTVVGFYDRSPYATASSVGSAGITRGDPQANEFTSVYLDFAAVSTVDDVVAQTNALFPGCDSTLHTALLRFMGVTSDANIWQTFFYLIVILIVVITIACISLISGAFNISVAERVSGFALLSSIGATPGQLRRSVFLEGLIIAVVGIPLGVLIGIAGCAITFGVLGEAIANVANGGIVAFELKLDAGALGVAALLTLVTVLISAWIPAQRASRANIIEALRQKGSSRTSRKGQRDAEKSIYTALLWKKRGLAGRIFGIGGTLARINRKRGSSKGRAAALSLALAIVLLMTAGSLNVFLGTLVDAASGGEQPAAEVYVSAQLLSNDTNPEATTSAKSENSLGTAKSNLSAETYLKEKNAAFAQETATLQQFYETLGTTSNAQGVSWLVRGASVVTLPSNMVGAAFEMDGVMQGGLLANGTYGSAALINYVDDATFDRYVSELGQDPRAYHDPEHLRAVALSQTYSNDGKNYQLFEALKATGSIEVLAAATADGKRAEIGFEEVTDDNGAPSVELSPMVSGAQDDLERSASPSDDTDIARVELEIAALADHTPLGSQPPDGFILLIVPESLAHEQGLGITNPVFYGYFNSADGDHAALAEALEEKGRTFFDEHSALSPSFISYNDFIAERNSTQMLATIVNVFCLLFTVILTLIAMANVFNTTTNSLILRQREFAVMRSIGLSPKQFRRMIIDECLHFGIAGLIPGLIVSLGVSYLLYLAVSQSLVGMGFMIPWTYFGLAILLTAAIMAISVAYGLHRCKSNNVVEALRADNI